MTEPLHIAAARRMDSLTRSKGKVINPGATKSVAAPSEDTSVAIDLSPITSKLETHSDSLYQLNNAVNRVVEKQMAQDALNVETADNFAIMQGNDNKLLEHINHAKQTVGQFQADNVQTINRLTQRTVALEQAAMQKTNFESAVTEQLKTLHAKGDRTQNLAWNLAVGSVVVSILGMFIMMFIINAGKPQPKQVAQPQQQQKVLKQVN